MGSILFLTSTFLPNPGANGLLTYKIIKELKNRGYSIYVIALKNGENEKEAETIENIEIIRIPQSEYSIKLNNLKKAGENSKSLIFRRRIHNFLHLKKFPNFEPDQTKEIFNTAQHIIKRYEIKNVVAMHKPYVNIASLILLNKTFSNLRTIAYFLDPLDSLRKPAFMPQRIYDKLMERAMDDISDNLDTVMYPVNKNNFIENNFEYQNFSYFEYPNFERKKTTRTKQTSKKVKILYAGTLDKIYRNPEIFFNTMEDLSDFIDLEVNIYGKTDINPISFSNIINNNGIVSQKEILKEYGEADILVNISNKGIDSVPSKIFELFSYGKPIINFVKEVNDPSMTYFQKYPLAFNFYEYIDFDSQLKDLKEFIMNSGQEMVDFDEISNLFESNTIEHFVDQLEKTLEY